MWLAKGSVAAVREPSSDELEKINVKQNPPVHRLVY